MKKIIDYILSALYLLYFGLILVIFHGIQWICFNLGGQALHQKSVNAMNFFMVYGWYLTGSSVKFTKKYPIPTGRTILFLANHQSMFDIPGIVWNWRQHTPLFVSKKELAKGIPSISYNLRVGKAAIIDRNDKKGAIVEIAKFGKYIHENKFSAAIFPEGTRTKNGELGNFQVGGVATLLKRCPNALVVPLAIENSHKFNPKGIFPLSSFTKIKFTSLEPIESKGIEPEILVEMAKAQIQNQLNQARS